MRALLFSTRSIPVAASFAAHVALGMVVGGHGASERSAAPVGATEIAIEIEAPAPAPKLPEPEAAREAITPKTHTHGHVTHTHAYPVAPDHDAHPHDPSLVHAPLAAAAPVSPAATAAESSDPTPASEPVHFVLTGTRVGTTAHAPAPATGSESGTGTSEIAAAPLAEAAVSTPARLVATAPALYPAAARSAEIEADVPVEIVVDRDGRVESAAATGRASGFGLDDAAARTVRAYRFAPATKDGRAVRVRMRWVVQFRLR